MKNFYCIFIILFFSSNAFAFENIVIPNENSSYSQAQTIINNEDLEPLEKQILKKSYTNERPLKRLSRLEKEVFGMEQTGDIEDRYENLLTAAEYYKSGYRQGESLTEEKETPQYYTYKNGNKNYDYVDSKTNKQKSYAEDYEPQYYTDNSSNKKPSKVKQFFNDLADVLSSGIVTGYTPPVYYSNFDPLDGTSFSSYPQIPPVTSYINTPRPYYNPYTRYNRPYYNSYVRPYYKQNNYYNPPPPPSRHNYRQSSPYYRYPGNGASNYGSGTRVRIIN